MNKILIQGAEPHETEYFEKILENKQEYDFGGYIFFKGIIGNKEVIVSRTRVGEINSAAATTIGILKFSPDFIINQGTAGGHGKEIHKGDIVLGEEYVSLNSFYSEYKEEGKGYDIKDWIFKEYHSDVESDEYRANYKKASKEIVSLVKNKLNEITDKKVYAGKIGSGDVWNREVDRILYLNEKYGTLCEEMESAGCYKVANNFNVPVIAIRIISNNEVLREQYDTSVAIDCQKIISEMISKL